MVEKIRKTKSLGLEGSRYGKEIFGKKSLNEDYSIDIFKIGSYSYICFYLSSEGKLQLMPII